MGTLQAKVEAQIDAQELRHRRPKLRATFSTRNATATQRSFGPGTITSGIRDLEQLLAPTTVSAAARARPWAIWTLAIVAVSNTLLVYSIGFAEFFARTLIVEGFLALVAYLLAWGIFAALSKINQG